MKRYKCHKEVESIQINSIQQLATVGDSPFDYEINSVQDKSGCLVTKEWFEKHKPEVGGYLVRYEDGYQSYSPQKAFEEGYSLITSDKREENNKEFVSEKLQKLLEELEEDRNIATLNLRLQVLQELNRLKD